MESKTDNDESKVAEDNDNQDSTGDVEDTEETKGQAKKGKDAKKKKKKKEEKAIDVDALLLKDEDIDDDFVKVTHTSLPCLFAFSLPTTYSVCLLYARKRNHFVHGQKKKAPAMPKMRCSVFTKLVLSTCLKTST